MKDSFSNAVIGPLLKYHRDLNMMTLIEAEGVIDLSRDKIDRIEKKKYKNISYNDVQKICSAFNFEISDIEKFDLSSKIYIFPKYIAEFIKKKRKEMKLSQRELSQLADLNPKTVGYIEENLKKKPAKKVLQALCEIFECEMADIAVYSTDRHLECKLT